ncbi:MBL fold metallo-hydrolase [Carnobacterium viridans]|uniref:Ribonuclease BN, tRNA processing enzyme n=1 Tax=Carnobacterium viridans TaxID=174587 RepID=A0A1H1BH97_9LACT|nr:MBL fold metallo-hydrolase [Carnobacterium viridans]UDE95805.1 MBL fold metallo-hydrolase [Carnobacterium viridans]SDQ50736.1 Ribonuclease BN, tRNA processing enzyme [Carnobacterium viridans]
MKLTILGFWGGYPTNNSGTSSYLLEAENYHLLIDAGSASLIALENHLNPLQLDAVILSHYHYDHIADLGVLQFTRQLKRMKNNLERAPLLPIYGHAGDKENFKRLTMDLVSEGIEYEEKEKIFIGPFEIHFMKTLHPVECYAMRINEIKTGKTLVYTADSGYLSDFISFSKDADVLLADTNFFNGMENHRVHMTASEVGKIANEANVKKVILTHLPQEGDLQLLKAQAISEAPTTEIRLAKKDLIIEI